MIRLSKSSISEKEIAAVSEVLREEFLGLGPQVQAFEKELEAYFGNNSHVVSVVNGTAALQLAIQATGVEAGDEVLVPSLTYVASYQAISATGALPVSCDVNLSDGIINLKDAGKRLTEQTKAIMPVHYTGNAGDLGAIYDFASKHKLRVIEDAAHAFGSEYKNRLIGSEGDVICFSFDGIKNMTCGEGGAIVSSDKQLIEKVKDLRLLGVMKDSEKRYVKQRSWDFQVEEQGWRYHMSDIMASIGRVQLSRFTKEFKSKRVDLYRQYRRLLKNLPGISLFEINVENNIVPHIMAIRVHDGRRDALREHLLSKNIQIGIHYKPNHLLKKFAVSTSKLPNAEQLYLEIMTLPLHVDLTFGQVSEIVNEIKVFLGNR